MGLEFGLVVDPVEEGVFFCNVPVHLVLRVGRVIGTTEQDLFAMLAFEGADLDTKQRSVAEGEVVADGVFEHGVSFQGMSL